MTRLRLQPGLDRIRVLMPPVRRAGQHPVGLSVAPTRNAGDHAHEARNVHDAEPSAASELCRRARPRSGLPGIPRLHRLRRGVDRRALHASERAVPGARSARRPGPGRHQAHSYLSRRLHAALSPSGGTRPSHRLARPHLARALLCRGGIERDYYGLGDVRRRRGGGRKPTHDGRVPRDHAAILDQRRTLRIQGKVLDRAAPGPGFRRELRLPLNALHQASPAGRHCRVQPEIAHA